MQLVRGFGGRGHGTVTFFELVMIQRMGDAGEQQLRLEGLLQEIVGAKAQDRRNGIQGGCAGQNDCFYFGFRCRQFLENIHTRGAGHVQVEDENLVIALSE